MGILVEGFWDRGVEAWGIDISPYAVSRVRPDMRMCCRQASLVEPIEGRYDLVTCIEVMEHMHEDEARTAAANLTRVTDRILFSSTPDDFGERTHFNVRPPVYWLKLFAEFGFWPDLEYDASYITPHAMLLRRRPEGLPTEALTLFVRGLKVRAASGQLTNEVNRLKREMSEKESLSSLRIQELAADHDKLAAERGKVATECAKLTAERDELATKCEKLTAERQELTEALKRDTNRLNGANIEIRRLQTDYAHLQERFPHLEAERARLEGARAGLEAEIAAATTGRDRLQCELNEIVGSPGWRIISHYRQWYARQVASRSTLVRAYEPVARWCLQRLTRVRSHIPPGDTTALTGIPAPAVLQTPDPAATASISYEEWIRENEPGPTELKRQAESAHALSHRPLLSLVLPVYRVEPRFLEECIRSVLAQTYDNWELCVADGCPEGHDNRTFLSRVASEDPRVKVLLLNENLGISGNSNAALATAQGEFVALLDHDDVLAPFALYEVAKRISAEHDLDLIYSDHDYINEASRRLLPLFKPDWSPEVMLSANYITHLTVIRRSLFDLTGGFDTTVDSAQDWDFFLRVVRQTQRIGHIPKVLYHWRMQASSTALAAAFTPSTIQAQLKSIQRHIDAMAWSAQAEMMQTNIHLRWLEPAKGKVSIVIPSKDKVDLLTRCIQTVLATAANADLEILIVDNGSTEAATIEYYGTLETDSRIRVLKYDAPFNYSAMNNLGATHASGDYLLFLNNDTEAIDSGWLQELIGWARLKEIGAVGAKLLRADGSIQHAGAVVGFGGFAGHPFTGQAENTSGFFGSTEWYRDYLAVTGACMAMRREVFDRVGGFDEEFISCGSDVEICLRLRRAGYRVVYNPFARLLHHECATRLGAVPDQDFFTSLRHYREFLERGDPYWNPNLSSWKNAIALRNRLEQTPLEYARRVAEGLTATVPPSDRVSRPPSDEEQFVKWFDFSEDDLRRSKQVCAEVRGYHPVRRLVWFIPGFKNPYYGGICTILRFADYLRCQRGVSSYYVVWDSTSASQILPRIQVIDRGCSSSEVVTVGAHDPLDSIPESDACIATLWATAFPALKYLKTKRKFYFVQDYEPLFYRAGTGSALAESTYRFGFYGIANTLSLKESYEIDSGQSAIHFSPCIDANVFFPAGPLLQQLKLNRPYRQLFCYARPNHPRNAFEMIAGALQVVKKRLGNQVRIVCAGDDWRPEDFGLEGIVENLGILDYEKTAQLYRESDCGVALMFTRHPSYIPFELMACGALVIANRNRWTEWLLKDGENCLLTESSATCLAETIVRGLENGEERARITAAAEAIIRAQYSDWDKEFSQVYDFMCDPGRYYL